MNGAGSFAITSKRDKRYTPIGVCNVTSRLRGNVTALHERDKSRSVTVKNKENRGNWSSELHGRKRCAYWEDRRAYSKALQVNNLTSVCNSLKIKEKNNAVTQQCHAQAGCE